jgi:phosphotransferase system HPr (HPr) family protein
MTAPVREINVVVTNQAGVHARPASAIIMTVAASDSTVKITNSDTGRESDGESTMGLLSLLATMGTRLRIRATGEDADEVLAALTALFESGFGED